MRTTANLNSGLSYKGRGRRASACPHLRTPSAPPLSEASKYSIWKGSSSAIYCFGSSSPSNISLNRIVSFERTNLRIASVNNPESIPDADFNFPKPLKFETLVPG
ncbi:hypothetical protein CHCC20496_4098 [Bacillus licheniformis]|nr:hypothetical protein CHCC20496_4098 [Bacillus licheniformis]